jgi:hypothetical protein
LEDFDVNFVEDREGGAGPPCCGKLDDGTLRKEVTDGGLQDQNWLPDA